MDEQLLVGHKKAAEILGTDPEILATAGDLGQIKFKIKGKRRFYSLLFLFEYLVTPALEGAEGSWTPRTLKSSLRSKERLTPSNGVVANSFAGQLRPPKGKRRK
ncbi:hypothetical protein GCM10007094_22850 [Pseudovibrio japonicus]|uniref:Uncharacterized protein n=1 Tax=Pseudovibrio japonicus TaxID=366534 RepID=A0ABQ3EC47_9HYPH|nr:hypothetical protein [Pseudovibrio japonicus]GHB33251.1 hypothetical protein GCM10007094_22850 [Pseudovibrio japonicus]